MKGKPAITTTWYNCVFKAEELKTGMFFSNCCHLLTDFALLLFYSILYIFTLVPRKKAKKELQ